MSSRPLVAMIVGAMLVAGLLAAQTPTPTPRIYPTFVPGPGNIYLNGQPQMAGDLVVGKVPGPFPGITSYTTNLRVSVPYEWLSARSYGHILGHLLTQGSDIDDAGHATYGLMNYQDLSMTSGTITTIGGISNAVNLQGTGGTTTTTNMVVYGLAQNVISSWDRTIGELRNADLYSWVTGTTGGTYSKVVGLRILTDFDHVSVTDMYGIYIATPGDYGNATVTRNSGVYLAEQKRTGIGTAYQIYSASTTTPAHFEGPMEAKSYTANGTAGMTTVVTVFHGLNDTTDCTMTFTGGILTATTCGHT